MWMMPLHLHVNQKSDYDDDDVTHSFFIHLGIANVNWVVNISNKNLFAYFGFSIE